MTKIKSQGGFTLIELLIVVLIIGILAAIAIPVFNGQRAKAKNSSAKSSLRNAQTAASSIRTINDTFKADAGDVRDDLEGEESALTFTEGAPTGDPGTTNGDNDTVFVQRAATVGGEADTPGIVLTVVSTGDKAYSAAQTDEGSAWVTNDDGSATAAASIAAVATVAAPVIP